MDGREVDAQVATEVMGWKRLEDGAAWERWEMNNTIVINPIDNWCPSTSISDAWRVVERMRELGWRVELNVDPTLRCENYEAYVYVGGGLGFRPNPIVCSEDSMPLAICLAALKALRP